MFLVFLISFVAGFILNVFCCLTGSKINFFKARLSDGRYGVSKLGGVAMVASFFISISFVYSRLVHFDSSFSFILTALALVFFLGMLDDFVDLSPLKKLFAQVAVSVFLVLAGIRTEIVFLPAIVNSVLTVLWFVALMNAFNFLDILDGLAAGISILCAATFLFISYMTQNIPAVIMSCALLGSNLSFLVFNFHPARLYMGDMGSLFNGMALSIIAVMISYAPRGREIALFVPLLVLALPLYDLIFVIGVRFMRRKSIIVKSRDHFVLRLMDKGTPVKQGVYLMYFFNLLFNLIAILLLSSSNSFGFFILFLTVIAWLIAAYKISEVKAHER